MIRVGTLLYGFCGGHFDRDSYYDKRVEAIGADWVVAREVDSGEVYFYKGPLELLESYTTPEKEGREW